MVTTSTIISNSVQFLKGRLQANITDPISSGRPAKSNFILTGYPKRRVAYPVITIRKDNFELTRRLGMQVEAYYGIIIFEIRIWARNEKERDNLTDEILNFLNTNQFPETTSNTSTNVNLHDYRLIASIGIDEVDGQEGILSSINTIQYRFLYGLD